MSTLTAKETKAAGIADALYSQFLSAGSFTFSREPRESGLAPASGQGGESDFIERLGFAGLDIQSVAFEVGTEDPMVHIYVTKGGASALKKLDKEVDGIKVRVNNIGNPTVKPDLSRKNTNRGHFYPHTYQSDLRVACGSSCAPMNETYHGTLGALVRKAGSNDLYILSNNHVLAAGNQTVVGMQISSPATTDVHADMKFGPKVIARHSEIVELRSGVPALVPPCTADLAIGAVADERIVSSWQGDDENGYDTPTTVSAPVSGMVVKKFGRTTGFTKGMIQAFSRRPNPYPFDLPKFKATVWFKNVWTVAPLNGPFALPGDSGSLVVSEDGLTAVGILFAADKYGKGAVIIPMEHAITHFGGLELVGDHGV